MKTAPALALIHEPQPIGPVTLEPSDALAVAKTLSHVRKEFGNWASPNRYIVAEVEHALAIVLGRAAEAQGVAA